MEFCISKDNIRFNAKTQVGDQNFSAIEETKDGSWSNTRRKRAADACGQVLLMYVTNSAKADMAASRLSDGMKSTIIMLMYGTYING